MSLTVRSVSDNLLSYLEPAQRVIPPGTDADDPFPAVLDCIHGALQELATLGPVFQFRDRRSLTMNVPWTIPIVSAVGSNAITGTGLVTAMIGCSIKIPFEPWNEIVSVVDGASAVLRNPCLVAAAGHSVTIYNDSFVLPNDVIQIFKPITLADRYNLDPVNDLNELNSANYSSWDSPETGSISTGTETARVPGTPRLYFLDGRWATGAEVSKRLKIAPMPNLAAATLLNYTALIAPPHFVRADIYGGTPFSDPGTVIPISPNIAESVFLPICRQRWTGTPFMDNSIAVAEINRQYQVAYSIIKSMFPQMRGVVTPKIATPAPAAAAPQQGAQ